MDTALFNIFDLPMVLAIFLSLILASVLMFSMAGQRHLLLAGYLYCIALIELDKVVFWSMPIHRLFEPMVPIMFVVGKGIGLLVMPMLYLYVQVSSNAAKPVAGSAIYLLIILVSGITLSALLYQSLGSDPDYYWPAMFRDIFFNRYYLAMLLCKYGLFFAFSVFYINSRLQNKLPNKKSLPGKTGSAKEVGIVLLGALLIYSIEFLADFLAVLKMNDLLLNALGILHNYMVLLYICLILIYMLKQHFLKKTNKTKNTGIWAHKTLQKDMEKVHLAMVEQKYYLESDITLEGLAKKLKMPEYQLSMLLNKNFQKKFFDFINYYRMEHAKKLMDNSIGEAYSILKILYDSGFNSKSAFNRCFKKYTGITPSEYRERLRVKNQ